MEKLLKKLGDAIRADKKEYALDILELISDEYGSKPIVGINYKNAGMIIEPSWRHDVKSDDHKIDEAASLETSAASLLPQIKNLAIKE